MVLVLDGVDVDVLAAAGGVEPGLGDGKGDVLVLDGVDVDVLEAAGGVELGLGDGKVDVLVDAVFCATCFPLRKASRVAFW